MGSGAPGSAVVGSGAPVSAAAAVASVVKTLPPGTPPGRKKITFAATTDTYEYTDDKSFMSEGTTYYRVVKA